jgi:hypothetical protein
MKSSIAILSKKNQNAAETAAKALKATAANGSRCFALATENNSATFGDLAELDVDAGKFDSRVRWVMWLWRRFPEMNLKSSGYKIRRCFLKEPFMNQRRQLRFGGCDACFSRRQLGGCCAVMGQVR